MGTICLNVASSSTVSWTFAHLGSSSQNGEEERLIWLANADWSVILKSKHVD
jgi:hypothetical protein